MIIVGDQRRVQGPVAGACKDREGHPPSYDNNNNNNNDDIIIITNIYIYIYMYRERER